MLSDSEIQIMQLEDYLNGTAWYIVRKLEIGTDIPQEITDARADARKKLSDLKGQ